MFLCRIVFPSTLKKYMSSLCGYFFACHSLSHPRTGNTFKRFFPSSKYQYQTNIKRIYILVLLFSCYYCKLKHFQSQVWHSNPVNVPPKLKGQKMFTWRPERHVNKRVMYVKFRPRDYSEINSSVRLSFWQPLNKFRMCCWLWTGFLVIKIFLQEASLILMGFSKKLCGVIGYVRNNSNTVCVFLFNHHNLCARTFHRFSKSFPSSKPFFSVSTLINFLIIE